MLYMLDILVVLGDVLRRILKQSKRSSKIRHLVWPINETSLLGLKKSQAWVPRYKFGPSARALYEALRLSKGPWRPLEQL